MNFKKPELKTGALRAEKTPFLSLSLVLHTPQKAYLRETLRSVSEALKPFAAEELRFFIMDNTPGRCPAYRKRLWQNIPTEIFAGLGNSGFGKTHNLLLSRERLGQFHLILNPDVSIEKEALTNGINFLLKHPEFALCGPVLLEKNEITHLGRAFPDFLSLFLRGFAPAWGRKIFKKHLENYTFEKYRPHLEKQKILTDIPCLSGSFLLMRGALFKQLRGFDPTFFLYFEDFDFSLRAQKLTRTALLPQMRIRHFGGNSSRKGIKHLYYFAHSAFYFFHKHGWKFF